MSDTEPRAPLIIFHFNCMDGLGALWAAKRALPEADVWSASYGQKPPADSRLAGRDVFIVDFSYGLDDLRRMATVARSVLVLDHHDTAREALAELPPPGGTVDSPSDWRWWLNHREGVGNLAAIFDMERSGAGLTWDYFHPRHLPGRPKVINLIEDRDLWRFRFGPETRAFDAAMRLNDLTQYNTMLTYLGVLHTWSDNPDFADAWATTIAEGNAIVKFTNQAVESMIGSSERTMRFNHESLQFNVPVVNVPGQFASEAGNALVKRYPEAPFVACYYDGKDGMRHFSLRARSVADGGFHVGQVARSYGGGGHPAAAGFNRPLSWEGEEAWPTGSADDPGARRLLADIVGPPKENS